MRGGAVEAERCSRLHIVQCQAQVDHSSGWAWRGGLRAPKMSKGPSTSRRAGQWVERQAEPPGAPGLAAEEVEEGFGG